MPCRSLILLLALNVLLLAACEKTEHDIAVPSEQTFAHLQGTFLCETDDGSYYSSGGSGSRSQYNHAIATQIQGDTLLFEYRNFEMKFQLVSPDSTVLTQIVDNPYYEPTTLTFSNNFNRIRFDASFNGNSGPSSDTYFEGHRTIKNVTDVSMFEGRYLLNVYHAQSSLQLTEERTEEIEVTIQSGRIYFDGENSGFGAPYLSWLTYSSSDQAGSSFPSYVRTSREYEVKFTADSLVLYEVRTFPYDYFDYTIDTLVNSYRGIRID